MKRRYKLAVYLLIILAAGIFPVWALIPKPPQDLRDLVGVLEALLLVILIVGGLVWVLWRPKSANSRK